MKIIELSHREYHNFKQIANFFFFFECFQGRIYIEANIDKLEALGY